MKSFVAFMVSAACRIFSRGDDETAQRWSQKLLGSWYTA